MSVSHSKNSFTYDNRINALYPISDSNPRENEDIRWRHMVLQQLDAHGLTDDAKAFADCQNPELFRMLTCPADAHHLCIPLPHTCHLPFCPECAKREHMRIVRSWNEAIAKKLAVTPNYYRYKALHITLTTSDSLHDDDIKDNFQTYYKHVHTLFLTYLHELRRVARYWLHKDDPRRRNAMTPRAIKLYMMLRRALRNNQAIWFDRMKSKIASGATLKKLGIGILAGAEFGERGKKLHFHCLWWGMYLEQSILSDIWKTLTGNDIVHINAHKDIDTALPEVLKYATKLSLLDIKDIPKLRIVFKSSRRIRSYGFFNGLQGEEAREQEKCFCPICEAPAIVVSEDGYAGLLEIQFINSDKSKLENATNQPHAPPKQLDFLDRVEKAKQELYYSKQS